MPGSLMRRCPGSSSQSTAVSSRWTTTPAGTRSPQSIPRTLSPLTSPRRSPKATGSAPASLTVTPPARAQSRAIPPESSRRIPRRRPQSRAAALSPSGWMPSGAVSRSSSTRCGESLQERYAPTSKTLEKPPARTANTLCSCLKSLTGSAATTARSCGGSRCPAR